MNVKTSTIKLSVIIPAYNEAGRISDTLTSVSAFLHKQAYQSEVLVVLNNCTDDTRTVSERFGGAFDSFRIIDASLPAEASNTKGYAVQAGLREALGDFCLFMDADDATSIDQVDAFWPYAHEYDVVIGSRYVAASVVAVKQRWYRVVLSRIGNFLIRTLVLPGVYDTQCGFKLFTHKAAKIIAKEATTHGWGADIEMLAIAKRHGLSVAEVGIVWQDKARSMVRPSAFFYTLRELLSIWLQGK